MAFTKSLFSLRGSFKNVSLGDLLRVHQAHLVDGPSVACARLRLDKRDITRIATQMGFGPSAKAILAKTAVLELQG